MDKAIVDRQAGVDDRADAAWSISPLRLAGFQIHCIEQIAAHGRAVVPIGFPYAVMTMLSPNPAFFHCGTKQEPLRSCDVAPFVSICHRLVRNGVPDVHSTGSNFQGEAIGAAGHEYEVVVHSHRAAIAHDCNPE